MCIIIFIINQVTRVEERRNEVFFCKANICSDGLHKDCDFLLKSYVFYIVMELFISLG